MPVPRRPFPGDEMHNEFAGGDARRFLRRARVRVLPQPTGRVAQLAERYPCRRFPGELASLTAANKLPRFLRKEATMARLNTLNLNTAPRTHEGTPTRHISP